MDDPAAWASAFETIETVLEFNLWKPLFGPMCTNQFHPDAEGRASLHKEAEPLKNLLEELRECQSALTDEIPALLF